MAIKILIADDHQLIIEGVKMLFAGQHDFKIIGTASNGVELIKNAKSLSPDVIITDINMPVMDGITAIKILKEKIPSMKIIALTMYSDDQTIIKTLNAGANGFLLKDSNKEEIFSAVKAVYNGDSYYDNLTSVKMAKMITTGSFSDQDINKFSSREMEILKLICNGLSNKEIASKVDLSTRSVEGHKSKIMEKMGVSNNIQIVLYAIKNNLIMP